MAGYCEIDEIDTLPVPGHTPGCIPRGTHVPVICPNHDPQLTVTCICSTQTPITPVQFYPPTTSYTNVQSHLDDLGSPFRILSWPEVPHTTPFNTRQYGHPTKPPTPSLVLPHNSPSVTSPTAQSSTKNGSAGTQATSWHACLDTMSAAFQAQTLPVWHVASPIDQPNSISGERRGALLDIADFCRVRAAAHHLSGI
jgi:hypothetical protein